MTSPRAVLSVSLVMASLACGGSSPTPAVVPDAPTAVTAGALVRSATVSWTAPASDGGSAITGYTVTASPGGATRASTGTSTVVTGLANGTGYTFTVTATNGVGTGPASAPSAAVTTPSLPGAPTDVIAVLAGEIVSLTWTAPASNGGMSLTGYTVLANPAAPAAVFTVTGTGATVTGLTFGTAYTFQVLATSAVGDGPPSAASSPVTPITTPSAPGQPTGTAGNGQVSLLWAAPASSGGSAVTGYTVSIAPATPSAVATVTGTGAIVTGLANGTSYTFTVTATNAAGTGPASLPSAAVTPATLPGAPTGVIAVADVRSATVSWTAPASNGGSAVTGYTVAVSPTTPSAVAAVTGTGASVTGLADGASYTFTVTATNGVGAGSPSAPSSPVTTPSLPGAPTGVAAVPGNQSVSLTWTAPASTGGKPLTGYTVLASPAVPGAVFSVTGTTATVTGLANGTAYTFQVLATSAVGDGPPSAASSPVTPRTIPSAPGQPTGTAGNGQVTLTWIAPASNGGSAITGYTVTAAPSGATLPATGTSVTFTGLINGTSYAFTVTATNAAGTGPASPPSAALIPAALPDAPTAVVAVADVRSATVNWTAPSGNGSAITGYAVVISPAAPSAIVIVSGTTATITGLADGTSYTFTVTATNAIGTSPPSAPSSPVSTPSLPGAPTGVVAVPADQSVSLSWTAPASNGGKPLTGYTVVASPAVPGAVFTVNGTTATVTGLANGTAYAFRVLATTAVGDGPLSAASAPVTPRTVPSAPGQPVATAGNQSVTLTWTAPPSDGGSAITGYTVAITPATPAAVVSVTGTAATVTGLANGTSYTFTVTAINAAGAGPASIPSDAVIPATVPGPPTGVVAVPGDQSVTLSWTAPASTGGRPLTGYTVAITPATPAAVVTVSGTTATVTGLANGTAYAFQVFATTAVGDGPLSAASAPVTPRTIPSAPGQPVATAGNQSVTLTWTAPASNGGSAITSYTVAITPATPAAVVTVNGTGATVTGLANGTSYTFTVTAINAAGAGPASIPSDAVIPATVPGPPTSVVAVADVRSATLTWSAPASNGGSAITGYTVGVSPTTPSAVVTVTGTGATVSGLANGTSYTFTVAATNAIGTGAPSAPSSAVVTPSVPGAPTGVVAVPADQSVSLSWTAPASNGGRPLTGYTVTIAPATPAAFVNVTGTTAAVTGLANGTAYAFQVFATSVVGDGPPSAASAPVTPRTIPSAPGQPVATAGNQSVTLTWTAPTSNGGSAITSYTVAITPATPAAVVAVTGTTATVTGLANGTSYTFTVTAINAAGAGPASIPSDAVIPATVPGAPTGVVAVAGIRSATLTWSAPASNGGSAITGYAVAITPATPAAVVSVTGTGATVSSLANGTSYTFTVSAINAAGTGPASTASAPVTTPSLPGAPTAVAAVAGNQTASLTWTAPASTGGRPITGYTVVATPAAPGAVFNLTGTTAAITLLVNEITYTFQVLATTVVGDGPPSAASNPVTPAQAPSALTYTLNPAIYTRGVAIASNAPANTGGHVVAYSVSPPLPAGLALDPVTGALSGTPTAIVATTTYTVTATNAGGSTTASLVITVNDVAPSALTYSTPVAVYPMLSAIAPNTPTSAGGPVVVYAVSPALPAGLSLNVATGAITGTPTAAVAAATYTVTATNSGGSTTAALSIQVVAPAPPVIAGPASRVAKVGATATFQVTATGTGTLTYQWFKGGSIVPGAILASYTTPAVVLADSGATYTVVVNDTYGGVTTSAAATLRVVSVNAVSIAVLNDVHLDQATTYPRTNPQLISDIATHLAPWAPQLVQSCGDVSETSSTYASDAAAYVSRLASVAGARSFTFGANDTYNSLLFTDARAGWPSTVSSHWLGGLGYGSFDVGGIHVILLDAQYGIFDDLRNENWLINIEGQGHIPPAELAWLTADLAATTKPSVVFSHQTLGTVTPYGAIHDSIDNAAAVRAVLEAAPKGVLAAVNGHAHMNARSSINGISYIIQTSTFDRSWDSGFTVHDGAAYLRLTVDPDNKKIVAEEWESDSVAGWRLADTYAFP